MSDITYELFEEIAKLENDVKERDATIKRLKADIDHNVRRALELAEENQRLKEALKTCIDELMYTSTTGHLWMWAKSNEAVPERLLEIRKLIY